MEMKKHIIYDDYNNKVRADQNTVGTITTNIGVDAFRNGQKIIEQKGEFFLETNFSEPKQTYAIRKLTPRECGRLMGFAEDDITAMESVNSATQVYKECGNSIVVDVLYYIFKQMM